MTPRGVDALEALLDQRARDRADTGLMATRLGTTFEELGSETTTARAADDSSFGARALGKEFRVGRTTVVALEGVDLAAPAGVAET